MTEQKKIKRSMWAEIGNAAINPDKLGQIKKHWLINSNTVHFHFIFTFTFLLSTNN